MNSSSFLLSKDVHPLYTKLNHELTTLLAKLHPEDWKRKVPSSNSTVLDLVLGLLEMDLKKLTEERDGGRWLISEKEEVQFLDFLVFKQNKWIRTNRTISPRILVGWMRWAGEQVIELGRMQCLNVGEMGHLPWFDSKVLLVSRTFLIGCEYVRRAMHQEWLRMALNKPSLKNSPLFFPVFDFLIRGVTHYWKGPFSDTGTTIKLVIEGMGGGTWVLRNGEDGWSVHLDQPIGKGSKIPKISLSPELAWKLLLRKDGEKLLSKFLQTRTSQRKAA